MQIELRIPHIQMLINEGNFSELEKIRPKTKHLKKLERMSSLKGLTNRRVVQLEIKENNLVGYKISDFLLFKNDKHYLGSAYIKVEELEKDGDTIEYRKID